MVGNVSEWVAEWVAPATTCTAAMFSETGDRNCLAGAFTSYGPAALIRGGYFNLGTQAGGVSHLRERSAVERFQQCWRAVCALGV